MSGVPQADNAALEERIGYVFANKDLLARALTHVSHVPNSRSPRLGSYQRLEFLGDRVLGLIVSTMLFQDFQKADEGELSRRLAGLVRKETCAEVAAEWNVSDHIRVGDNEAQSGSNTKPAIMADVCEAIIGAVYLDGGYEAATKVVSQVWQPRMMAPNRPLRDPKTALQEWAQSLGRSTPSYREVARSGPAHAPLFTIAVTLDGFEDGLGEGSSKRVAEQIAAEAFMVREGIVMIHRKG